MKILLINKFHYIEGGGERSYFDTANILAEQGHDLAFFSMKHKRNKKSRWSKYFVSNIDYNSENLSILDKIKASINIIYNFEAKRNLEKLIKDFRPDVAHLHNIYRQLSPSIIDVLKKYNIPIVMTLHDYALVSPARTLSVRGKIWEKDRPNKQYRCIFDKCVKNSYLKSFLAVVEVYLHKWMKIYEKIDVFISPSNFLINKFKEYNFKKEIVRLPHSVEIKDGIDKVSEEKYILYYGRLTREKGIEDLIEAYSKIKDKSGWSLKIVGAGLEEERLKKIASDKKDIEFLGFKRDKELNDIIKKAAFVVFPGRCYENAPYSLLESMALAKIVLVPEVGGYRELIEDEKNGYMYRFGDIADFSKKIKYILEHEKEKSKIGEKARKTVKEKNSKEEYYKKLYKIYKDLIKK